MKSNYHTWCRQLHHGCCTHLMKLKLSYIYNLTINCYQTDNCEPCKMCYNTYFVCGKRRAACFLIRPTDMSKKRSNESKATRSGRLPVKLLSFFLDFRALHYFNEYVFKTLPKILRERILRLTFFFIHCPPLW